MHTNQFVETVSAPKTESALAGAIMRHWHSRHLHSKALVICDSPETLLKSAQKQWRRFIQLAQQERLHNTGADRILTLTYEITHMQHASLANKSPSSSPSSHMWFVTPGTTVDHLPSTCRSVYVTVKLSNDQQQTLVEQLPRYAVAVDFARHDSWPLAPKSDLEQKVNEAWEEVLVFFNQHNIEVDSLVHGNLTVDAIDNALDTLLDVSSAFLRHAHHFQEVLSLAEPLLLDHQTKLKYDATCLLARRVSLLVPNTFGRFFMQQGDDTFFMYDTPREVAKKEQMERAIKRHRNAGRQNIVFALERLMLSSTVLAGR